MIYAVPCRGAMDPENMLKMVGREQGARHTTGPLIFAVDSLGSLLPHSARLVAAVVASPEPLCAYSKQQRGWGD